MRSQQALDPLTRSGACPWAGQRPDPRGPTSPTRRGCLQHANCFGPADREHSHPLQKTTPIATLSDVGPGMTTRARRAMSERMALIGDLANRHRNWRRNLASNPGQPDHPAHIRGLATINFGYCHRNSITVIPHRKLMAFHPNPVSNPFLA